MHLIKQGKNINKTETSLWYTTSISSPPISNTSHKLTGFTTESKLHNLVCTLYKFNKNVQKNQTNSRQESTNVKNTSLYLACTN